jgi:DnaK suppressor protein
MLKRRHSSRRTKRKAATSEVLGVIDGAKPVPRKWRESFQRLTELRESLLHRRTDSVRDALSEQPSFSTHMADAATDTYDRDLALGMLSSEQDALYQIDEALDRIRAGTYGVCELTGKPIEAARLEAVPWTRFTAAAEKQMEREGELKLAHLGARESVGRGGTGKKEPEETE